MSKSKLVDRLSKLFAMLGSANANEHEVARKKIDDLLTKNKKTWNDLTELLRTGAPDASWNADDPDIPAEAPAGAAKNINALTLVHFILEEYVALEEHEYVAVALWILHTHVSDRFLISPRLALLSPVRGCGKTTLLAIIQALAARAEKTDNITPAAVYYLIDGRRCTLLVDEADNLGLAFNGPLRAVFNSGHRKGGAVTRVIRGQPKRFSTFTPMAIAAIGSLPLPLTHRSIVVRMERHDGARRLRRLDDGDTSDLETIYQQIWQWTRSQPAISLNPVMPPELRNRAADNWRPLIAIADTFGEDWGNTARAAAVKLKRGYQDEDMSVVLLRDIRSIFDALQMDRISSKDLVDALIGLDDGLWSEWRGIRDDQHPRCLSQGELARLLASFQIRPRTIWPLQRRAKDKSRKGYFRSQFERAWRAYADDGTAAHRRSTKHLRGR